MELIQVLLAAQPLLRQVVVAVLAVILLVLMGVLAVAVLVDTLPRAALGLLGKEMLVAQA
jgi:hypothetical protein